jgi:hypothetical protein
LESLAAESGDDLVAPVPVKVPDGEGVPVHHSVLKNMALPLPGGFRIHHHLISVPGFDCREEAREIKQLGRYEGLIIDDLGYLQQSRDDMEVVFTLLAERYERGSVLMTSNLPFSKWEAIFKDAMMTAAAIDRLVHHSVIIELNIPSYRVEHAKQKQQAENQIEGEGGGPT